MVGARHAARKSEPIDDHWRWALSHDLEPRVARVAVQIDENLHAISGDASSRARVVQLTERRELVRGGLEVLVQWVVRFRTAIVGEGFDAVSRVQLEHFGDQVSERMLT